MSESAESWSREDTVIFLTLLFVYGLQSRSTAKWQAVGATSGQGAGSEAARWEGSPPPLGCFYQICSTDTDSQGLVLMRIQASERTRNQYISLDGGSIHNSVVFRRKAITSDCFFVSQVYVKTHHKANTTNLWSGCVSRQTNQLDAPECLDGGLTIG